MSEIKVNKISPRTACGTTTLGDSGDTFTIPSGVTISNSGTATGFGGTGEISWDTTVKTTGTFTATAGIGYFLNTGGGTITVNLPAGTAGSSVAFADYAGTWQTSNVTISPNGTEKIGGTNADVTLNTEGQSVQFVYIDGTQGWINVIDSTSNVRANEYIIATGGCITTCGNCKMHTFLSPGTFTVSCASPSAANNLVSYMVVGGGGGGGGDYGAGAGAGGFREVVSPTSPYSGSPLDGYPNAPNRVTVSTSPGAYPIIVGGGGTKGTRDTAGTPGDASSFSTITSAGGGVGGMQACSACSEDGGNGGSGGGARYGPSSVGSGNTPPTSPPQGNNGGAGHPTNAGGHAGGGGGGAGAVGQSAPACNVSGDGGNGVTTQITASPVTYGGGGGGAGGGSPWPQPYSAGAGGTGGGGAGAPDSPPWPNSKGYAGGVNTGGGGGGGNLANPTSCGGQGGSGIVIIRYRYT